jgi:hypothetical protein
MGRTRPVQQEALLTICLADSLSESSMVRVLLISLSGELRIAFAAGAGAGAGSEAGPAPLRVRPWPAKGTIGACETEADLDLALSAWLGWFCKLQV